uniref:DUF659 domain-containing protein n=1 Tax=Lactuca sativa TaxID=4236 RepID=A0A9R1WN26_LACSA|nr:hypothetical protein LSAT_V11C100042390 [Lactuca sativa]
MKQYIALVMGYVSSCPKSTKDDQLKCKNSLSEGKVEVRQEFHEAENSLGSKVPNVMGPKDNYANLINPEEGLKEGKGKNVDLNNIVRKQRILTVNKFISRWAYESVIPFHAFQRDSLKMMLEEWKEDGCLIITNPLSDRKRRSIMNLCVNSKMGTVFLSSKECSGEAHTSQHIYVYVESCIQQVGPENVFQVATDTATSNMGAAKLLKEKRPSIFWTSYATHTINRIGELPRFKKILNQAKKLTIFVNAHHKTLAMMRSYTKKREIIRPRVTRFASAFLTLQSFSKTKHMFSINEWEECKFSGNPKGIASYKTVTSVQFWSGVTQCLKVCSPLVKVLRMVHADWKPSMGFVYGEIKIGKEEIIKSLGGNEKHYKPIIDIINTKMNGRLDSTLHLTSYLLNLYYHYNDSQLQYDPDVMDAVHEFFDTLFCGDLEKQRHVVTIDLPKYKKNVDRFGCDLAIKHCKVVKGNGAHLKGLVHTNKRNRLETSKLNNLVYFQFNANLMEKNKKRKDRNMEVLLANNSLSAQEWIVDCDECDADEVHPKMVDEALATDVSQAPQESTRTRELLNEDFESESESEKQVLEEEEYESDGVQITEVCGED